MLSLLNAVSPSAWEILPRKGQVRSAAVAAPVAAVEVVAPP